MDFSLYPITVAKKIIVSHYLFICFLCLADVASCCQKDNCVAVSQTGLHTITVCFSLFWGFLFLRFQVCLVEFPNHPITLPKPQPLPALGFRVVSLNPDVPPPVGGIRSMWANVLCVLHVKVRLEAEVASGVTEELILSPSPSLHRFRPNGRLLDLCRGGSLEKSTLKLICGKSSESTVRTSHGHCSKK